MTIDFSFGPSEVRDFIENFRKHGSINQLHKDLEGLGILQLKKVISYCDRNSNVNTESFDHMCKRKAGELGCIHYTPRIRAACAILVYTRHKGDSDVTN